MLCPVFHMGEDFEMFSLLNRYLHFPFPSCAAPGCYFPAVNLEFYSIFAQGALFPVFLGLCKPVSGFFVCKQLERVCPSLIWIEYVYRKHPQPSCGIQNTGASHWLHQCYSNAVGSCIPFCYKIILFMAV